MAFFVDWSFSAEEAETAELKDAQEEMDMDEEEVELDEADTDDTVDILSSSSSSSSSLSWSGLTLRWRRDWLMALESTRWCPCSTLPFFCFLLEDTGWYGPTSEEELQADNAGLSLRCLSNLENCPVLAINGKLSP